MLLWTAIIAIATVVYVIVSGILLRLTKKMFEATNRPFLMFEMPTLYFGPALIKATINNKGHVPSSGVIVESIVMFENKDVAVTKINAEPLSIFPDISDLITIEIDDRDKKIYNWHMNTISNSSLDVFFNIKYIGIAGQKYSTNCHYRFDLKLKQFVTVRINWT